MKEIKLKLPTFSSNINIFTVQVCINKFYKILSYY